jgi:histidine triad (HIT) family protein
MPRRSNESCAFCDIARGAVRAHVVADNDRVIGFLDRAPLLLGHVLVAPRDHVETLDDLHDALVAPLFIAVRRMSVAVQRAMGADGSFVATNTRISQSVAHLHVHVVPRRKGDGLFATKLIWQRQKYSSDTEASAIASKIKAAFDAAPD